MTGERSVVSRAERPPFSWPRFLVLALLVTAIGAVRGALDAIFDSDPDPPPCHDAYLPRAEPMDDGTLPGPPGPAGVRTRGVVRATIQLTQGPLEVELFADRAPCTVHSFLHLVRTGFYDETLCHRLTTGDALHVLQCGDPTGTGRGGPGYGMVEENPGDSYPPGTLAMARTPQRSSGGSQFFVVYDESDLLPGYTVFGRVVSGLDVVRGIASRGVRRGGPYGAYDGRPAVDVRIEWIAVAG